MLLKSVKQFFVGREPDRRVLRVTFGRGTLGSAAERDHLNLAMLLRVIAVRRVHRFESLLGVAIVTSLPDPGDALNHLFVGRPVADQLLEIEALAREQTSDQLSVGGYSSPRAIAAEWFGDRCNDSDVATAVFKFKIDRRRPVDSSDPSNWKPRVDAFEYLRRRHHP